MTVKDWLSDVIYRDLLRSNVNDEDLLNIIGAAVGRKEKRHAGKNAITVIIILTFFYLSAYFCKKYKWTILSKDALNLTHTFFMTNLTKLSKSCHTKTNVLRLMDFKN